MGGPWSPRPGGALRAVGVDGGDRPAQGLVSSPGAQVDLQLHKRLECAGGGCWSVGSPSTSVASCTATPQARREGLEVGFGPSGASAIPVTARHSSWRARAGERPSTARSPGRYGQGRRPGHSEVWPPAAGMTCSRAASTRAGLGPPTSCSPRSRTRCCSRGPARPPTPPGRGSSRFPADREAADAMHFARAVRL
jgi:hypothetical protein